MEQKVLREFFGNDPKRKHERCVEGKIMSIACLNAWVTTSAHCLVERKNHGGQHQKVYADRDERLVDTATKQLIGM